MSYRKGIFVLGSLVVTVGLVWMGELRAGEAPEFTRVRRLTNGEVALTLAASNGASYRIDSTAELRDWSPLVTLAGSTSLQHTDSAAPYLAQRFYRAARLPALDPFTGDHFRTENGDVTIHPLNHASFLLRWNDLVIYNDPVPEAGPYTAFPKADLILVSHTHGDHFNTSTLEAVRKPGTIIITPRAATNSMSATLRGLTTVLTNGGSAEVLGIQIAAVPAYNSFHPVGTGNGYVLTIGGRRFYMSGDTGAAAEIRALTNIDVAFLCMNLPFTMDYTNAASVVRSFQPRVIYPYHYRNQNGTFPNFDDFKRRVGQDLGIEVRLRRWY
jgi:L-ascorbate metabolism protein UlaG (beta-lactamase superfamily)